MGRYRNRYRFAARSESRPAGSPSRSLAKSRRASDNPRVPNTDTPVPEEQNPSGPSQNPSGPSQIRSFLIADVRGYTLFTQERGTRPRRSWPRSSPTSPWRFGEELHQAFSRIQAGDLDVMVSEPGPRDLAVLRSTRPDQVLAWPAHSPCSSGSIPRSHRSTTSAPVVPSAWRSIAGISSSSLAAPRPSARRARSCRRTSRGTCVLPLHPGTAGRILVRARSRPRPSLD
jgi:hypothetical protein